MCERKPSEPISDVNVEILQTISEYLLPQWRCLIKEDNTLLKGRNVVDLFNLEKMKQSKILRLKCDLKDTLPMDIFLYLMYQRRREQKKTKRQERDEKAQENVSNHEMDMIMLRHTYRLLSEEKSVLKSEIQFYEQFTPQFQQF